MPGLRNSPHRFRSKKTNKSSCEGMKYGNFRAKLRPEAICIRIENPSGLSQNSQKTTDEITVVQRPPLSPTAVWVVFVVLTMLPLMSQMSFCSS